MRYTATDYISAYVNGNRGRMREMAHEDMPQHIAWAISEILCGYYHAPDKSEQALFTGAAAEVGDYLCSTLMVRISQELEQRPEWAKHHKNNPFYK